MDGVLGDAVKLPCVAAKPALVAEGMGYILDSDVSRIRKQRQKRMPEKVVIEPFEPIQPKKSCRIHWAQFPTC
jgi:hypothetical protein